MKYNLVTLPTGEIELQPDAVFVHPVGLTIPRFQTVKATVPNAVTLSALFSNVSPFLPVGFTVEVYGGGFYARDEQAWVDESTSENADGVEISGVIHLRNNASFDIGITW